jgi:hypothetical protein
MPRVIADPRLRTAVSSLEVYENINFEQEENQRVDNVRLFTTGGPTCVRSGFRPALMIQRLSASRPEARTSLHHVTALRQIKCGLTTATVIRQTYNLPMSFAGSP